MHVFYFLLALFGFIGWEAFWGVSEFKNYGSFVAGLLLGAIILLFLGILGMLSYGLWSIT